MSEDYESWTDIAKLEKRIADVGGSFIGPLPTSPHFVLALPHTIPMTFDNMSAGSIQFINLVIDGLEAKDKVRRCVEHFDKESNIKCFIAEDSTAADLLHCTDVNSRADAYRDAAKFIRHEFGIEEGK